MLTLILLYLFVWIFVELLGYHHHWHTLGTIMRYKIYILQIYFGCKLDRIMVLNVQYFLFRLHSKIRLQLYTLRLCNGSLLQQFYNPFRYLNMTILF